MIHNTAVSNWHFERKNWTTYYERQLQRQLTQAVVFIQTASQPQQLNAHFDSFLVLLRRAHARPDLHMAYIDLLTVLHPWPLRWGQWDAWELELEQALPILAAFDQAAKQAELMTYLAEIQFRTGRLETAVHTSRAALNLAWENQVITAWAAAGSRTILALNRLGQNDEARRLLTGMETQLATADFVADMRERLEAVGYLLLRRMVFMRYDGQAAAAAREAQIIVEQLAALPQSDRRLLATLYTDMATMLWVTDQYETAVTALKQAIAIYTELGAKYEAITTRGNLGLVYWSMARLPEAEAAIRESLQLAESLNARWRLLNEIGNLCAISFSQGNLAQALHYTQRHLKLASAANDAAEINRAQGNRALAHLYLGNFAAALPDLEASLVQLRTLGLQQQLAETYLHLGCCFYGLGRLAEAKTAVYQAEQTVGAIKSPALEGLLLRCHALLAPLPEAFTLLEKALAVARQSRRRLDEARCYLRLSTLSSDHRRDEFWEAGVVILHEIGATAWLENCSQDKPPLLALLL